VKMTHYRRNKMPSEIMLILSVNKIAVLWNLTLLNYASYCGIIVVITFVSHKREFYFVDSSVI
jgi:hypothetical protein